MAFAALLPPKAQDPQTERARPSARRDEWLLHRPAPIEPSRTLAFDFDEVAAELDAVVAAELDAAASAAPVEAVAEEL